jgi:ATP-binding cassette, subfamily B, bacterial
MSLPKKPLPFIIWFIKKQIMGFSIVLMAGMIWAINEMCFPYFLKWIINSINTYHGIPAQIYTILSKPLIILAVLWMTMELAMRVQGIMLIYLYPRFRANIREAVLAYIKQHSHRYFAENFAGSISKKLSELPSSCQNITEIVFFNFVPILLAFVIAFVLMTKTKLIFSFIMLGWFLLHFVLTAFFLRHNNNHWSIHSESVSTLSGKIVDVLTNMITVRLFARSKYERNYLSQYQKDEISKARKALWSVEWMRILQGIIALAFMAAMIGTLVHGWTKGWVSIGDFSLIGTLAFWMLGMIWYMSYQLMVFIREVASVSEALNLISIGHDIKDKPNALPLRVVAGKIEFKAVSFGYQQNKTIFDNFNLTLHPGQKIGLVGFSGSGKSTFVNLLLRFYDVQKGQILIDGQDIREAVQDSLREQIAMIPQEPTLFHRSLMDNIRYGNLEASDDDVLAASTRAYCHDFIKELPEGYDTLVGERGIKLSGGQRQRIAIARAIVKNAPILILDEATSSLDSITEKLIQQSLDQLMANRTTIVVAHRLSTLAGMDRILVFDNGSIVEDGAASELLKMDGYFAQLWQMQKNGFLPETAELELSDTVN